MGWGFWKEISAKSEEEIMEIFEPYDLTGSLRAAAELADATVQLSFHRAALPLPRGIALHIGASG